MPVGDKTVSETIEDTENEPGESGERKRKKVPLPQLSRHPSKDIEGNQCDVKNDEQLVE